MEGPDSCSMTPPMSPMDLDFLQNLEEEMEPAVPMVIQEDEELEHAEGPCRFSCKDISVRCHTSLTDYLQRGYLKRLLDNVDPAPNQCPLQMDDLLQSTQSFFYLIRQKLMVVENLINKSNSTFSDNNIQEDCEKIRETTAACLDCVEAVIYRLLEDENRFLQELMMHLKLLVLDLAGENEILVIGSKHTAAHHLFHLRLDMILRLVAIFHRLSLKHPANMQLIRDVSSKSSEMWDVCSQLTQILLWKLLQIANLKHKKTNIHDSLGSAPFPCSCVKEAFVFIIHLTNARQSMVPEQSFWTLFHEAIQHILQGSPSNSNGDIELDSDVLLHPPHLETRDPVWFSWWLFYHMLHLVRYDVNGNYTSLLQIPVSSSLLNTCLLKSMLQKAPSEGMLRLYTAISVSACSVWEPDVDTICTWWDFLYKKLNENFNTATNTLSSFAYERHSSVSLVDQLKKVQSDNYLNNWTNFTSFQGFLRLLALALTNKPACWKQLKGRLYSKFHTRRMQELTEVGLHNFGLLFGTLTAFCESDEVSKFSSLVSACPNTASLGRQQGLWTSVFAVMLLCVENKRNVESIAEFAASRMNDVCRELSQPGTDIDRKHDLWKLVQIYLDGAQGVFDSSPLLDLGEHILFCSGLTLSTDIFRSAELNKLIHLLNTTISKLRELRKNKSGVNKPQHKSLADALWSVHGLVRNHARTNTPPQELSAVAAGYTLLLVDSQTCGNGEADLVQTFLYFGTSDQVNTSISCNYLCHLLPDQELMATIRQRLPGWDTLLVKGWLRCCCFLMPASHEMQLISRTVIQFPVIENVIGSSTLPPEYSNSAKAFFKMVGQKYAACQVFMEKMKLRENFNSMLTDLIKHLGQALKDTEDTIRAAYKLAGHLVMYCAPLIYIKSKPDCLLPGLLDRLILPRLLFKQSQIPPAVFEALRESLHLYVYGFGLLDHSRDPFLNRKLADIVVQYLPRFAVKQKKYHPIIAGLTQLHTKCPGQESQSLKEHVLSIVKAEFLAAGSSYAHHQHQALQFTRELLKATSQSDAS